MTRKSDPRSVLTTLRETGACLDGHFRLSSGLHSDQYFQCALALSRPDRAEDLARAVASLWSDLRIGAVVGPAIGGIVIAYEVARQLGVRALFTERREGEMTLRRGFAVSAGEPVLLCEDVITTGRSVGEALEVMRRAGANPVGLTAIVRRRADRRTEAGGLPATLGSGGAASRAAEGDPGDPAGSPASTEAALFGVPLRVPLTTLVRQWEPAACPLCRRGIAVTKPGSRPQP